MNIKQKDTPNVNVRPHQSMEDVIHLRITVKFKIKGITDTLMGWDEIAVEDCSCSMCEVLSLIHITPKIK